MIELPAHDRVQTDAEHLAMTRELQQTLSDWRVFSEAGTAGNSACVYISAQPVLAAQRQQLAAAQPDTTHCFSWMEPSMTQSYRVHCHSGQTEIQRCGHGFLAVAGLLLGTGASPPLGLLAADDTSIAVTPAGDGTTADSKSSPVLEIHLPRVQCQKAGLPEWVYQAFRPSPIAAATAGGDHGYWVFEWGADCDLSQLYVDSAVISRHSQRAVIATQADSADPGGYDFRLRYFAPQYGTVEDAVTGSANAVLADYWAGRLGVSRFRALQCSSSGGVVYSRLTATSVAIGGKVERL